MDSFESLEADGEQVKTKYHGAGMNQGGYVRAGLGCGVDTQCGCAGGLGSLLVPSTWGPADWLVAAAVGFAAWKVYGGEKKRRYVKQVRRRLGVK